MPFITEDETRCRSLVDRAIKTFGLDCSGLSVLTEAATSYYTFTPLIAALAGAERVYALARDTRYGRAADVGDALLQMAGRWGVDERINILLDKEDGRIAEADIVTNLGNVRPMTALFLKKLKGTVAIPLMWETWEFRGDDLDLECCRSRAIPVLGTNEHHPDLRIFEYVGIMSLKLLLTADVEVFRSRVAVIGTGEIADQTVAGLKAAGAEVSVLSVEIPGALTSEKARAVLSQSDAAIFVEHHIRRPLVGPGGELSAGTLRAINSGLTVVHMCGGVDRETLVKAGFRCYPERFASPGYVSVATEYLGPRPIINLLTAGLKVGESMTRARHSGLHGFQAEMKVLRELPLAMGFAGYHDVT